MTKLTKQEIEKEREMFEGWFLNNFKFPVMTRLFENCHYRDRGINMYWEPWLARAELAKGGE